MGFVLMVGMDGMMEDGDIDDLTIEMKKNE
jgi:hypothetical protein